MVQGSRSVGFRAGYRVQFMGLGILAEGLGLRARGNTWGKGFRVWRVRI